MMSLRLWTLSFFPFGNPRYYPDTSSGDLELKIPIGTGSQSETVKNSDNELGCHAVSEALIYPYLSLALYVVIHCTSFTVCLESTSPFTNIISIGNCKII